MTNAANASHALAMAASRGMGDIVSLLLDRGVDINAMNDEYGTALVAAVFYGMTDMVSLLIDREADVNAVVLQPTNLRGYYGTALALAASYGMKNTVSVLLNRGADINKVDGNYGTALAAAASCGREDIVLLLLEGGADINTVGDNYGNALAAAVLSGMKDIVSLLLDRGAYINAVGSHGTALAVAASRGAVDIVSLLLDRGADINAVGGNYETALTAAVLYERMSTVLLLLNQKADIDAVGDCHGTALALAASCGMRNIVLLLLDRGADTNKVGGFYKTALGAAASCGMKDIVLLLLERRADIDAENCHALRAAISYGNMDIALLLLDQGANFNLPWPQFSIPYSGPDAELSASRCNESLSHLFRSEVSEPLKYTDSSSESLPSCIIPPNASPVEILPTSFHAGGIITAAQANVACKSLSEEALSESLAALVGLHEHAAKANSQWIQHDVKCFISCNLDFGLAYAAARVAWKHFNEDSPDFSVILTQRLQWHKNAQLLDKQRSKAIAYRPEQELIISPYSVMPRHIWDLRSNRVVDFRMLHAVQSTIETKPTFWAVSHSWTSDMSPVWTRINQYQWPIPLPKDITLDHVRSELLNLGAEYVWIDVVCLRQQTSMRDLERLRPEEWKLDIPTIGNIVYDLGRPSREKWKLDVPTIDNIVYHLEQLRREEWKLDVPTIGNIYRAATHIVRYFNGLGVPFSNNGWDDSRHWLQRAWTLQEIANENTTINGGISQALGHVLLNSEGEYSGKVVKLRSAIRPVIKLAAQVGSALGCEVYELVREMIRRHASQPLDKLSGLFYLLGTTKLPCYDDKMTSEDIWRQCFHLLPPERKAEILFDFPYRGSDKQWFPTWAQMLSWPVRDPECDHMRLQSLPDLMGNMSTEMPFFVSNLWIIPRTVLFKTSKLGEYGVEINDRRDIYFYLPYLSQKPIDLEEPEFALAIANLEHPHYNWVVCRVIGSPTEDAKVCVLKKVGVMRTDSCTQLSVGGLLERRDCLFI